MFLARLFRSCSIPRYLFIVFLLLCCWSGILSAAPITTEQAVSVVSGWRKTTAQPLKAQLGTEPQTVETFSDEQGKPLYHVVYMAPSGFVVVPADDRIEPIICFATAGRYDPGMDNPLGALVSQDIKSRFAAIDAAADKLTSIDTNAGAGVGANADADIAADEQETQLSPTQQAQGKWRYLNRYADSTGYGDSADSIDSDDSIGYDDQELITYDSFYSISDVRVEPLVQSKWSQAGDNECDNYCYNYYTPNHYICGCVATALAQVLRFHQHPVEGIGVESFTIYVDGYPQTAYTRGGNGTGGPYYWDLMVPEPGCDTTPTQRQAIGALCYDAGLSVNMSYSSNFSGAYSLGDAALKNTFGYSNAVNGNNSDNNIGTGLNGMINPNLDCGYPVILGITGEAGGHAIVADGYGYDSSTLYHHLNLGWAGAYDAWYNLPNIDTYYEFNSVSGCIYNIYVSGTGEIISGRVTDELGEPVSGALITAQRTGGGTYEATTNDRGIYALSKVPSASTFTVSAVKEGYDFEDRTVTTGTSADDNNTAGNRWAIDFVNIMGVLSGSGTPQDPYLIQSLNNFRMLAYNSSYWDDCIRLESDINLGSQHYYTAVISPDTNIYVPGFQGTKFSGTFDGNGHKISNMRIDPPNDYYSDDYNYSYLGLFGKTDYGATIKNLRLENCYVTGEDHSNYVGALAGYNYKAAISNCYATGHVDSEDNVSYVGGLIGFNYQANINNCYTDCTVDVEDRSECTGGFVGKNHTGTIRNCYAKGTISFNGSPSSYVGGLAGCCQLGVIDNCYSTVNIEEFVATSVGGLCGWNDGGTISDSFWDTEASNMATSAGGTGKTTAQMQDVNTFLAAGWDFISDTSGDDNFWKMPNAGGYPIFCLQEPYDGGDGSVGNPYQIRTSWQLLFMGRHWEYYNKRFLVTADIDLSSQTFTTAPIAPDNDPATQYLQGTPFTGTFDGGDHKVTNLIIGASGTNHSFLGMFGQVNTPGLIKNLSVENVSITTGDNTQLLGALVGYAHTGSVISNCYATGSVTAGANAVYLGGLIGANNGHINDCYARVSVAGGAGSDYLGGLTGYNAPAAPGFIDNCYSTGTVTGTNHVGGLVGDNNTGSVTDSFWDTDTSGLMTSDGGEGKTTAQMQDINTFLAAGWNFVDIWKMPSAGGYPIFPWQEPYNGGDGSAGNPYQISKASELIFLGEHPDYYGQCFILTADIDLSLSGRTFFTAVIAPDTDGSDWYFQGTAFTGTFDGNNHKILNLCIIADENNGYLGLFGCVGTGAVIKNLGLENPLVDGYLYSCGLGSLAGENCGTITNCWAANGQVISWYYCSNLGGLVGCNLGNINNSWTNVSIDGFGSNSAIGGLVGSNELGTITTCYATGDTYSDGASWHMGGLVGYSYDGVISDCYAGGNIDGESGCQLLGGLVGEAESGSVSNCYSTGWVSGNSDIGGLIGRNSWCSINSSFWDIETSGLTESDGGTGKTTAQMQDINTFLTAGWDFENLWHMPYQSTGYPMLFWQRDIDGDLAAGYGVTLADFAIFSQAWLTSSGQPGYNDDCDLVDDDTINMADLLIFAENFLQGI